MRAPYDISKINGTRARLLLTLLEPGLIIITGEKSTSALHNDENANGVERAVRCSTRARAEGRSENHFFSEILNWLFRLANISERISVFSFFDLSKNCQTTHGHEVHIYFESYDLDGNRITRKRFKIESARLKGNFPRSPRRSHAVGFSSDFSLSLSSGAHHAHSRAYAPEPEFPWDISPLLARIYTRIRHRPLLCLHWNSARALRCFFYILFSNPQSRSRAFSPYTPSDIFLHFGCIIDSCFTVNLKNSTETKLFNGTISPPRCRTHCGVRAGALVRL